MAQRVRPEAKPGECSGRQRLQLWEQVHWLGADSALDGLGRLVLDNHEMAEANPSHALNLVEDVGDDLASQLVCRGVTRGLHAELEHGVGPVEAVQRG